MGMSSKELREGNLLYGAEGQIVVCPPILIVWVAEGRGNVKPIPLTEDWLERLGCKKSTDKWGGYMLPEHNGLSLRVSLGEFYIGAFRQEGYSIFYGIGKYHGFNIPLKHVHQLQNLFFALTNNELTINETTKEPKETT